jgi:hypothetical protein
MHDIDTSSGFKSLHSSRFDGQVVLKHLAIHPAFNGQPSETNSRPRSQQYLDWLPCADPGLPLTLLVHIY